jgi:hypothetical protein
MLVPFIYSARHSIRFVAESAIKKFSLVQHAAKARSQRPPQMMSDKGLADVQVQHEFIRQLEALALYAARMSDVS